MASVLTQPCYMAQTLNWSFSLTEKQHHCLQEWSSGLAWLGKEFLWNPHFPETLASLPVYLWIANHHTSHSAFLRIFEPPVYLSSSSPQIFSKSIPCFPLSVLSQRNNYFSLSEIIIYLLSRRLYPYIPWNHPINPVFPFIHNPSLSRVFPLLFTSVFVYSLFSSKSLLWSCLYIKLPFHLFPLAGNFWK